MDATLPIEFPMSGIRSLRTCTRQNRALYFFGEEHEGAVLEATLRATDHVVSRVIDACAKTKDPVHFYLEISPEFQELAHEAQRANKTFRKDQDAFLQASSPIKKLYAAHFANVLPPNARTFFCNIRHTRPFCILQLLFDERTFEKLIKTWMTPFVPRTPLRPLSKLFETKLLELLHDTETTMDWIASLVHPDKPNIPWMIEIETALFGGTSFNPIKEILRQLPASWQKRLLDMFFAIVHFHLKHNGTHTAVLKKWKRRAGRKAHSVVAKDAPNLTMYIFALFVFLQDLYMACVYALNRNEARHHLFFVGDLHVPLLYASLTPGARHVKGWLADDHLRIHMERPLADLKVNLVPFQNRLKEWLQEGSPMQGGGKTDEERYEDIARFRRWTQALDWSPVDPLPSFLKGRKYPSIDG